jgi:phosphoenolpyruvate---glycerone phosphotransferase subunit DhaL
MAPPLDSLLDAVAARIIAAADELTALDSAIGDADHGLNMKRGFEAVLADKANILAKPLPEALKTIGHDIGDEGGRRIGPALWHAVHDARQGTAGRAHAG